MSGIDGSTGPCGELQRYEIRVQGHLDSRWAGWLQGQTFSFESDGTTAFTSPLVDQSALHGLLSRIRDLGLPIISMRRVCPDLPDHPDREANQASEDRKEGTA